MTDKRAISRLLRYLNALKKACELSPILASIIGMTPERIEILNNDIVRLGEMR